MAATAFLLIASATLQLSAAAHPTTCASQQFANNTKFQNCVDLPVLNSFLHWSYDAAAKPKPTLAVAFAAPPPTPEGWVAWGPNPTADGMVGVQAFVAFKDSKGCVTVKTYNISSYDNLIEGRIAYDVVEKSAQFSGDLIWIFAKISAPEWPPEVSYVWQVGPATKNGVPTKHDVQPDNLNAKAKLKLSHKESGGGNAPSPSPSSEPEGKSGAFRVRASVSWVQGMSLLLGAMTLGFWLV